MSKIAIVHDHILEFGGAERVFVTLKRMFPDADVYTAAYNKSLLEQRAPDSKDWHITESWAARIPFFRRLYSPLRFLTPWIWESFDFTGYDVVISSSGWFMSKGIITRPETKHISYVHHQPRYLYYYATSVEWQKFLLIKIYAHFINHFLRMWDFTSSQRPDILLANSEETQRRIKKFYRRDSHVVYPPVDLADEKNVDTSAENKEYYVVVSRLSKMKHIDLIIQAVEKAGLKLKIVGTGRDEEYLKSFASTDNVTFEGHLSDSAFAELFKHAKGFIMASIDEEFGIAPVEAMSYGVPVIAFASGGLKETVQDGKNGLQFGELTVESLGEALGKFEALSASEHEKMRKSARTSSESYSEEVFHKKIRELI